MNVIILLLLSAIGAHAGTEWGNYNFPDWWHDTPRGYSHRFIVGYGYSKEIDSAREEAYRDVLRQLSEERGVQVESSESDYSQTNEDHSVGTKLRWRSAALSIDSLKIAEEHTEVSYAGLWMHKTLVRLPSSHHRFKPPKILLATSSMILPGSGHYMIGCRTRGNKIMMYAGTILAGSIASYYLQDHYGEPARRASILLGLGYLGLGAIWSFDAVTSKYINEYD